MTAAAALGLRGVTLAQAQDYPSQMINWIVPYPPGSPVDIVARRVATALQRTFKTTIIINNKTGANGVIGAEAVAKGPPDGYTFLVTIADPLTLAEVTRSPLPYDPGKDLLPVSKMAQGIGFVMVAHPDVAANTLPELLDLARRNPGKLSYGSYGIGSLPHVTMEALARSGNVSFLHVPYRGSPPATQATVQKEVDVTLGSPITMMPFINDKKLKPIVLTQRLPTLPGVGSFADAGFPDYIFNLRLWQGMFAPGGTPAPIVERMSSMVHDVVQSAELKEFFDGLGFEALASTPKDFASDFAEERAKMGQLLRQLGLVHA